MSCKETCACKKVKPVSPGYCADSGIKLDKKQIACNKCEETRILTSETIRKINQGKRSGNCMKCRDFSGDNNPNKKYYYDNNFFKNIETEEKAYLLGWIGSDGCIQNDRFTIAINKKDSICLENLKNIICKDIPIVPKDLDCLTFSVCSKTISKDLCELFNIKPGKKSDIIEFPNLNSDNLKWAFIRGYFDGDGSISKPGNTRYPKCTLVSNSKKMRDGIVDFIKIPCSNSDISNTIELSHNNALDFLSKIYDNSKFHLTRKKDLYIDWSTWVSSLSGNGNHGRNELIFKWNKTRKDAVAPSKSRATDSGYDLVLLEKIKTVGKVEFYDTGIKIQPDYGWYFDVVPRSSITKTGYILANSIGIIDRTYIGNILVPLIKIDENMPDLELPIKLMQLIPRPIIHVNLIEVEELDNTERGSGGFGSTGLK